MDKSARGHSKNMLPLNDILVTDPLLKSQFVPCLPKPPPCESLKSTKPWNKRDEYFLII